MSAPRPIQNLLERTPRHPNALVTLAAGLLVPVALAQGVERTGASEAPYGLYGIDGAFLHKLDPATDSSTVVSGVGLAGYAEVVSLAFDPNTGTFFAEDVFTRQLIRIDPVTRTVSVIGPGGWFTALAFDPSSNVLYATDGREHLLTIDPVTGARTDIGELEPEYHVSGLAFDPSTNTLWGVDYSFASELIIIDPNSAAVTLVGPLGLEEDSVYGLAFDPHTNTLYTRGDNSRLVIIDPGTGAASFVGSLGFYGVLDLAFDPGTSTLYGADRDSDQLFTIDPVTLVGAAVMPLGFPSVIGLAFDPNTDTLYGVDGENTHLITIDSAAGTATAISALPFERVSALAFDSNTNTLYGVNEIDDRDGIDELITIDPATATGTVVGPLGYYEVEGLAFDPNTNSLYGLDDRGRLLINIDPVTGAGSRASPGMSFFNDFAALAFDANTNTLIAVQNRIRESQLFTIVPGSGEITVIGSTGFDGLAALAFDPNTNTLYGTDANTYSDTSPLLMIDSATGGSAAVGTLAFDRVQNLAFDPLNYTLYGLDDLYHQLITIDPFTGAGAPVAPRDALTFNFLSALTFDPAANTLYAIARDDGVGRLVKIGPTTGVASVVAVVDVLGLMDALLFDWYSDTLFGAWGEQLVTINKYGGAVSTVGSLDDNANGLTLDPFNNSFLGTGGYGLTVIDPATGAGTLIAPTLSFTGLALLHPPDCNLNRVPDADDIADQTSFDCNGNTVPDECDISRRASRDCTGNGVPDECVAVCTDNCECYDGNVCTLDRCQGGACGNPPGAYGDVDHSGHVNVLDIFCVLSLVGGDPDAPGVVFDADIHPCERDGVINIFDVFAILNAIAGVDPCCNGS